MTLIAQLVAVGQQKLDYNLCLSMTARPSYKLRSEMLPLLDPSTQDGQIILNLPDLVKRTWKVSDLT